MKRSQFTDQQIAFILRQAEEVMRRIRLHLAVTCR